jgi:hypothetical protein
MANDALDTELCHSIRVCWGSTEGLKSLKGLVLSPEALDFAKQFGQSEEDLVRGGVWGCGDSASRLCSLLVGEELNNYNSSLGAADAVDISDKKKLTKAINDMRFTTGCILARMNVLGGKSGSGHSYVFLGLDRVSTTEPLDGHIYQTNIGCNDQFDLLNWISDKKFASVVNLETHLKGLEAEMASSPVESYEKHYMLSSTSLKPKEVTQKTTNKVDGVRFMWRQVDLNQARANLKKIRNPSAKAGPKWPPVAPATGARMTI